MRYLLIIAAVITFSACQEKIPMMNNQLECPDYDPTTLNTWFPYQQDVTYNYADSTGDIHSMAITEVTHLNGDEPASMIGCTPVTQCFPTGRVFSDRNSNLNDEIMLNAIHYPTDTGGYVIFAWNSPPVFIVSDESSLNLDHQHYYSYTSPEFVHHAQLWLNEVAYSDVYEITFFKNDVGNTRKVYLAKGKGVIGYQTMNGRTYWAK